MERTIDGDVRFRILKLLKRKNKKGDNMIFTIDDIMTKASITEYEKLTIHGWLDLNSGRDSPFGIRREHHGTRAFFTRD